MNRENPPLEKFILKVNGDLDKFQGQRTNVINKRVALGANVRTVNSFKIIFGKQG